MQEQIDNVSKQRDEKSKESKKARNKKHCMKNVFDGLFTKLDRTKGRISEFEDIIIETSKTEQKEKKTKQNTQEL